METDAAPTIGDLYPHLTEKELSEAEDNIERYLELVLRIFERTESEMAPQSHPLSPTVGALGLKVRESS